MRRDLHIIEDFRAKARNYTGGETLFMLDGSAEFHDARLSCITAIDRLKAELGSKTETFIWGNDNGSVMNTRGLEEAKRLGDLDNGMLLPTLSEVQMMVDYGMRKPPVHIVLTGIGAFRDDDKKLEDCFRKLMAEPGVLVDVILGPGKDTKLEKMILRLKEEKKIDRVEEPLRLTCINNLENMDAAMFDAINARLFYDSEESIRAAQQFMLGSAQKFSPLRPLTLRNSSKE